MLGLLTTSMSFVNGFVLFAFSYTGPSHLHIISKSLHGLSNWQSLGKKLNMEESFLKSIEKDYAGDVNSCREVLLLSWLHSDKAAKNFLVEALKGLDR